MVGFMWSIVSLILILSQTTIIKYSAAHRRFQFAIDFSTPNLSVETNQDRIYDSYFIFSWMIVKSSTGECPEWTNEESSNRHNHLLHCGQSLNIRRTTVRIDRPIDPWHRLSPVKVKSILLQLYLLDHRLQCCQLLQRQRIDLQPYSACGIVQRPISLQMVAKNPLIRLLCKRLDQHLYQCVLQNNRELAFQIDTAANVRGILWISNVENHYKRTRATI